MSPINYYYIMNIIVVILKLIDGWSYNCEIFIVRSWNIKISLQLEVSTVINVKGKSGKVKKQKKMVKMRRKEWHLPDCHVV